MSSLAGSRPLRVVQLLSSTSFHGAESMAAELIRQLHKLGVENHIALLDNAGRADEQVLHETRGCIKGSVRLPCGGALDPQTFRHLGRYLRDHDIDVVHSHKYKTTFYALPVAGWQGRGLVTTYHNWITTTPALKAYAALDKALARFNDVAVGVSTPVVQTLRGRVPVSRLKQIDNGIDTDVFKPAADAQAAKQALGLPLDRPILGCVGRLSSEKGLDRLLNALAALPSSKPWLLLIAGDGEDREALQAQASSLGLAERVRFLGRRSDTALLYQAMDLYLLPSRVEAFPMALLEAMASGCACVAADVGEVARMIDGGVSGRLVRGEGPEPWTHAINELLPSAEARRALAQSARPRVLANYSSRAMAEAYLSAYEQASSQRGG